MRNKIRFFIIAIMLLMVFLLSAFVVPVMAMSPGAPGIETVPPVLSPLAQMFIEVAGLSVFLFAAVAWLKQYGVNGKKLTLASLGSGLVIGFMVRYATAPPVTIQEWIWAVLYGLLCGFVASGTYKGGQSIAGTDKQ